MAERDEARAEVARMRPVVESAGLWRHGGRNHQEQTELLRRLMDAVDAYLPTMGEVTADVP